MHLAFNTKDKDAANNQYKINFSKTASEFKKYNKYRTEKNNNDLFIDKEAPVNNQQNLMRQRRNTDIPREFLPEENESNYNNKLTKNLRNNNFNNPASYTEFRNNNNQSSTVKLRGNKILSINIFYFRKHRQA